MKKSKVIKIIFILLLILTLTMCFIPTYVQADTPTTIDPDEWEPSDSDDGMTVITDSAGIIVDVIRTVGIVVTVVITMIIGIKYMTGSIEERAEYKKSMKVYIIGVVMFFALSQLLAVIIDLTSNIE